MKADERTNRVRLVKYGLPAGDVAALEARYPVVMEERKAIERALAHHAIERASVFNAVLDGLEPQPVRVALPVEQSDEEVAPQLLAVPVLPPEADPAKLLGLRAALGLG